ncbi:acyl carrier protein [Paenibacillus contaminans]|uniref:Acyl carrier protein n=1 Tax=Paenibacillus contaminans TaxID=450362 RepID=A0A329M1I9_9BACL|nr:acyl carrier protein [Paenibacillus contaminans]RAV13784.1 acyl carrier protein [Paenibacillus contaminans]
MNLQEFTKAFEEIVMVEEGTVQLTTELSSLDDWDSLSRASLLSVFEESFQLKVEESIVRNAATFQDIIDIVKDKLES